MKRLLLVSLFLAINWQFASAQWLAKSSGLPGGNGIVWMTANGEKNAYGIPYAALNGAFYTLNYLSITNDGGASWRSQSIPGLENQFLTGAEATTPKTVYITAQNQGVSIGNFYYGGGSKVMRSKNGGSTWTRVAQNAFNDSITSFADLIFFFNQNHGVIFGDPQNGSFEIYTTQDGGDSWIRVPASNIPPPLGGSVIEYGLGFLGDKMDSTAWVMTVIFDANNFNLLGGRLLQSDDEGHTWYVKNANMEMTGLDGIIRFRNHSVGLYKNNGNLYRTTNGGTTWTKLNYDGHYYSFCFDDVPGLPGTWISTGGDTRIPANSLYGAGSSVSFDDGDHWVTLDENIDHMHVIMTSPTHGYSGGISNGSGNSGMFLYSFPPGKLYHLRISGNAVDEKIRVNIYPNPSATTFSILVNESIDEVCSMSIYDMAGRFIMKESFNASEVHYFGDELAQGIYQAVIMAGNEKHLNILVKE